MYSHYFRDAIELTIPGHGPNSAVAVKGARRERMPDCDREPRMTRISIGRRGLLGATLLATMGLTRSAHAVESAAVVAPIQQLCDALVAVMHAGRATPFQQRFDQLAPIVEKAFNLQTILQVSVGPFWAMLPPDETTMLEAAFRQYTIASYVNSFDNYNGQRFEVSPQLRDL